MKNEKWASWSSSLWANFQFYPAFKEKSGTVKKFVVLTSVYPPAYGGHIPNAGPPRCPFSSFPAMPPRLFMPPRPNLPRRFSRPAEYILHTPGRILAAILAFK